jgi:hypothetical protein
LLRSFQYCLLIHLLFLRIDQNAIHCGHNCRAVFRVRRYPIEKEIYSLCDTDRSTSLVNAIDENAQECTVSVLLMPTSKVHAITKTNTQYRVDTQYVTEQLVNALLVMSSRDHYH